MIDAADKVVVHGFCDSHIHVTFYGNGLLELGLGNIAHREELFGRVNAYTEGAEDGKWVLGNSWNNLT